MNKINSRRIKRVFNKIPKSVKYLTLTVIILLFVLEFMIFPPLSAQIKYGSFTYQEDIEKKIEQFEEKSELKNEQNNFIGTWGVGSDAKFTFNSNGVLILTQTMLGEYLGDTPYIYEINTDNKILTVKGVDLYGEYKSSQYHYEFIEDNILQLKYSNGKTFVTLIKME